MLLFFAVGAAVVGYHFLFGTKAATPTTPTIAVCGARVPSDVEFNANLTLAAPTTAIQKVVVPATSIHMAAFHLLPSKNEAYILTYTGTAETINIYNLTTGALVTSFPVQMGVNPNIGFALDPQGNVYVNERLIGLHAYGPTGSQLWSNAIHANWGAAYGYLDASHTFRVAVNVLNGTGNFLAMTGQSYVFDTSGNQLANNNMFIPGYSEQDPATGDIMAIYGGVVRVYTNTGSLKLEIGTDIGPNTPGPFHFYILSGVAEKPGGGYYVSDQGHGMESFDSGGGYLGIAPDFNSQNGAANTIGSTPGWGPVLYNGRYYYILNGGINTFDANNRSQGLYSISTTDLTNDINYPQGSDGHFGIGAGFFTTATDNFFPSGTAPQVSLQFYSGWQTQGGAYTGTYTVRNIEQIKAGQAGSTYNFSIPTAASAYVNDVATVPISLPTAPPGDYEISAHLYKAGQPVGADCLNYTVGAPSSGINPASPNLAAGGDTAGIEQAHQFGQHLYRSGYSLSSCYPGITTPTMATAAACPAAMISDTTSAAALAKSYGMNYEIQVGAAGTKTYLTGGTPVYQHLVQQMVAAVPNVMAFECWNEPDNNSFSSGSDYVARGLIPCHDAVKAVRPTALVVGGSFSSMSPTAGQWTQFIATGLPYVDVIAFHTYTGHNRSFEEQGYIIPSLYAKGEVGILQQFESEFSAAGFHGQYWDTEQGFWVNGPYNTYTQGDRLIRKQVLERSIGINDTANFLNHADYTIDCCLFTLIHKGSFTSGGAASGIYGDQLYGRPFVAWLPTNGPHTYAAEFGPGAGKTGNVVVTWADDFSVNIVPKLSGGGAIAVTDQYGQTSNLGAGAPLQITGSVDYLAVPAGQTLSIIPYENFSSNLAAGATATASASLACNTTLTLTPDRSVDGILDTQGKGNICDGPGMSLWAGGNTDANPVLTIRLAQPKSVDRVYVSSQGLGSTEKGLRNYTLSFDDGSGSFAHPVTVSNLFLAHNNLVQLPQTLTVSRIQISNMAVNFTGYGDGLPPPFYGDPGPYPEPPIYEVEAYGPAGTTPPPTLAADFNNDGRVDISDLSILASHYGQSANQSSGDANHDGTVNVLDLSILASEWGQ